MCSEILCSCFPSISVGLSGEDSKGEGDCIQYKPRSSRCQGGPNEKNLAGRGACSRTELYRVRDPEFLAQKKIHSVDLVKLERGVPPDPFNPPCPCRKDGIGGRC